MFKNMVNLLYYQNNLTLRGPLHLGVVFWVVRSSNEISDENCHFKRDLTGMLTVRGYSNPQAISFPPGCLWWQECWIRGDTPTLKLSSSLLLCCFWWQECWIRGDIPTLKLSSSLLPGCLWWHECWIWVDTPVLKLSSRFIPGCLLWQEYCLLPGYWCWQKYWLGGIL